MGKPLTPLELHPRFLGTNHLELIWDSFFSVVQGFRPFTVLLCYESQTVRFGAFFSTIIRCGAEVVFWFSYAAARCGSLLSLDPTMHRTVKRPGEQGFRRFIRLRVCN